MMIKTLLLKLRGGRWRKLTFCWRFISDVCKYAEEKKWKIEILNTMHGAMGGFTSIEFIISGDNVYSTLKHEAGVHRVQRVPETESQGRVHTSTATVLVMPEAEELEVDVAWNDIKFDTFFSSGPGGQS